MIFKLKIDNENAAFSESPTLEVARLLRQTANRLEYGVECGVLMEINGNHCGDWHIEVPDDDT